jgi:hypothetical protein
MKGTKAKIMAAKSTLMRKVAVKGGTVGKKSTKGKYPQSVNLINHHNS